MRVEDIMLAFIGLVILYTCCKCKRCKSKRVVPVVVVEPYVPELP